MRLGIFASGNLGFVCLQALLNKKYLIVVVFTDQRSDAIIEFCNAIKLPIFIGNPRNGKGYNFVNQYNLSFDLLISVNYLFILEEDLIRYPRIAAINFHGSLLPRYRGRTPHVWAIINQEKQTGVTAHFIEINCDNGPIIDQITIKIEDNDTGGSILNRFESIYPSFVEKIIDRFVSGPIHGIPQDHKKATYFGKRTPNDGRIQWTWQKERIEAWVRAQSYPYPGAFCFYNDQKIIIDRVEFCELGFNYEDHNGLILEGGRQPVVKTVNGAIRILKIRDNVDFRLGEKLN